MNSSSVVRAMCTAVALMAVMASRAVALDSSDVVLGFGERYTASDGSSAVHRGADLACQPDAVVSAPLDGTVAFAGRVPGPSGTSVLAVTLDTSRGKVTVLPLEELDVDAGQAVSAGGVLGDVAATGDPSSLTPHVHMSLRVDGVYLDPVPLLAVAVLPEVPQPQPVPQPAPLPGAVSVPGVASGGAPAPSQGEMGTVAQVAPGVELTPANAPVPAPSDAAQTLSAPEPGSSLAPGVRVSPAGEPVAQPSSPPSAARLRLPDLDPRALGVALIALAAAGWAVFALLARRVVRARVLSVQPVSDRLGTMLQHMRTGDTLRGLTSCSGLSAFTVPEPYSPEEVTK